MSTFRILTVCTGNICRSPLAEQLLRTRLADLPGVTVESAGIGALVGEPMTAQAQAIARRSGVTDAADHVARQLTEQQVADADLIIGLSREHRRAVVELVPAALRRTFTLRELARLAAEVTDDDIDDRYQPRRPDADAALAAVVDAAASLRGIVVPPETPDDDDVIDPYRQSDEVYQASADQLIPAIEQTAALLHRAARTA